MSGSPPATPSIDLLLRHREWLRRMAASLVVDAGQADDLVQGALLAALQRPPAHTSHPRAWLATIVRRLARHDAASARQRGTREQFAARPEPPPPPDEIVAATALQHEVSAAVLALDEPYRTALLLRFSSNLSPRAIAKRTAAPVETVRTRLKRGVELVRAEIVRRRGAGGVDGAARREWAVGLLGLLDPWARRAVRRALLSKSSLGVGAGAGAGFSAAGALGVMGVIAMSTKIKLCAAAIVLAAGAFTIVKLREPPQSRPEPALASDRGGPPGSPAPASVDPQASALPSPAEATRAADAELAKERAATPTPAPTPPAATAAIEGIVRSEAGVPVSGAVVVADVVGRASSLGTLYGLARGAAGLLDEGADERSKVKLRTRTGADGRFRLEGLPAPANVDVAAVHAEWGMGIETGRVLDPARSPLEVDLTLIAGTVIVGTVTDRHGDPIRDARVGITVAERKNGGVSKSTLLEVKTSEDGTYRTLALPFRDFAVDASAPGFADLEHDPVTPLPSEHECRSDFVLEPARRIAGRIVTADGAPARLDRVAREFLVVGSWSDPAEAVSGTDGLGMHGTLARDPDRYEVVESWGAVKWVSLWCGEKLLGAVEAGEVGSTPDLVVDLSRIPPLPKSNSLRVVVVDAASGDPIADFDLQAMVDLHGAFGRDRKLADRKVSGSDGSVVLEGLLLGDWLVGVRAAGYSARLTTARVGDEVAGSTVEVALARGARSISGGVVDESGAPVRGARVLLLGADGGVVLPEPDCCTITNTEGRFAFGSVVDGDYSVVAELENPNSPFDATLAPAAVAVRAGAKEVALVLRAGVLVRLEPRLGERSFDGGYAVRVRDERGVPIFDQLRPGRSSTTFGDSITLRLASGAHTVEFFAKGHRGGPQRFLAAPDAVVRVEMVPLLAER